LYQFVVLNDTGIPTNATLILASLGYILVYTLVPRFTIGIRELYDRDIRGRLHTDTGFGVLSQLNVDLDTTVSTVVFGVNQGLDVEGDMDSSGDLGVGDRDHGSSLNEDAGGGV
ncbi:hypothetical protein EV363DRAFT_1196221, partial [Boletus edulis]